MGYTSVKSSQFSTGEVNDGYKVSFYISTITNNTSYMVQKTLNALSIAMQIPVSRIYMLTSSSDLDSQLSLYDSTQSSFKSLKVQFLIAPDPVNDNPSPSYYAT